MGASLVSDTAGSKPLKRGEVRHHRSRRLARALQSPGRQFGITTKRWAPVTTQIRASSPATPGRNHGQNHLSERKSTTCTDPQAALGTVQDFPQFGTILAVSLRKVADVTNITHQTATRINRRWVDQAADREVKGQEARRVSPTLLDCGVGKYVAIEEKTMPAAGVTYQRTREMTIDELLLENRVVFLIGEINQASAARVMMQMLYLENIKRGADINFYINSPGGAVDDTLALYDTMRFMSAPISTYCLGRAYSGAALLLTAGQKGKRFMLPHAKVMIHQPYGGVTGQAEDIRIQAEQIIKSKRELTRIIAENTGRSVEQVHADSERDKYFSAEEAVAYGLADEVLKHNTKTT